MQRKFAVFTLGLILLTVTICTSGQQKSQEEFISAVGLPIEDAYEVQTQTTYKERFEYSPLFGFSFFEDAYDNYRTDKRRYEYKFDDHGNWIQRKAFTVKNKQAVPIAVTYRTITYYK